MLKKFTLCLTVACACTCATTSFAQTITTTRIVSGLSRPVFVTAPPGDTTRLFIVEQRGSAGTASRADIRIFDLTTNTLLATPFLSINGVSTGSEQGLLGLAFHPDYANNRTFFVYYTNPGTQIVRYKASVNNPNVADVASATNILSFSQPFSNHNGGWMGFGPDGYLYIATGDGGSAGDPNNNGQSLSTLLGKLLRLAVTDSGTYTVPATNPFPGAAAPFNTIWAYGLRNPWRCAFDRQSGELWIGDVGQNAIEEISYQPADVNGSMGGRNYGWRCYEGNAAFNTAGCAPAGTMVFPVHTYGHTLNRCSVTGGYVYRGSAIPSLQGHYFFADYCGNQIYSFQYAGVNNPPVTDRTAQLAPGGGLSITSISSFGEDASGEMYICDLNGGEVFKIVPGAPANDLCANATLVSNGPTAFTTASATTDGPDEGGACFSGSTQISNDVWFKYFASCDGTATVSLCGATFNTRLAVYAGCPTGPGQTLACNDDACGTASEVSFPVVANTLYRIRIGGVSGGTGSGTMTISCTAPPPCVGDISGDNVVNVVDMLAVINSWGACAGCPADLNNDGTVNVVDLLAVINAWGNCP